MRLRVIIGFLVFLMIVNVLHSREVQPGAADASYEFELVQLVIPSSSGIDLPTAVSRSPPMVPNQISGTLQQVDVRVNGNGSAVVTGQVGYETVAPVPGRDGKVHLRVVAGGAEFTCVLTDDGKRVVCTLAEREGFVLVHNPNLIRMLEWFSISALHAKGFEVSGLNVNHQTREGSTPRYTVDLDAEAQGRGDSIEWLTEGPSNTISAHFFKRSYPMRNSEVNYMQSTMAVVRRVR